MSFKEWSESDIQSLKAQEAKDLAIEFLQALQSKEQGPISPGEVQVRELEYELKLKNAQIEDEKQQREHDLRIRELELQLEQQRTQSAQASSHADAVRQELQALVDRVRDSEEALAVSLERATRQHRLKLEQLQSEYEDRRVTLDKEHQESMERRDALTEQIQQLSEMQVDVQQLEATRESIERKQSALAQQQQQLDDEIEALEFKRSKHVSEVEQKQDLELARLKHEYNKQVLLLDREAADQILAGLNLIAVEQRHMDDLHAELNELRNKLEDRAQTDEAQARDRFRREYNITREDAFDVTELHYQHQAAIEQIQRIDKRIEQLDAELAEARKHIQGEPQRIAAAVEAARTPIHNIVEPASKR